VQAYDGARVSEASFRDDVRIGLRSSMLMPMCCCSFLFGNNGTSYSISDLVLVASVKVAIAHYNDVKLEPNRLCLQHT